MSNLWHTFAAQIGFKRRLRRNLTVGMGGLTFEQVLARAKAQRWDAMRPLTRREFCLRKTWGFHGLQPAKKCGRSISIYYDLPKKTSNKKLDLNTKNWDMPKAGISEMLLLAFRTSCKSGSSYETFLHLEVANIHRLYVIHSSFGLLHAYSGLSTNSNQPSATSIEDSQRFSEAQGPVCKDPARTWRCDVVWMG